MENHRMMFWKKDRKGAQSSTDLTQAMDASQFEEKDVGVFSLFGPFIKNYASSMSHTKNPSKLPYPTCFYLPQSSLMHMVHLQMSHIDLLVNATMQATPEERFLGVLQYNLSTWALTKFPYKPIISLLGETAHYSTQYAGSADPADKTYVIAENLRKDPPSSCFHITNPAHGLSYAGTIELAPKFKQAHIHVSFTGQNNIVMQHPQGLYREEFRSDIPDLMIRLLRMHTELAGEVNVHSSTGYSAKIVFKEKAIFGKAKNQIAGVVTHNGINIYTIDGAWDEVVYLTDCRTSVRSELLNKTSIVTNALQTPPPELTPATHCDKVWGEMCAALLRQDFNTANVLKAQINGDENRILADMEQKGEHYIPRFFKMGANGHWEVKDPALARDMNLVASVGRQNPALAQRYAVHAHVDPAMAHSAAMNNQGTKYMPAATTIPGYTHAPGSVAYTTVPAPGSVVYTTTPAMYAPAM